MPHLIVTAVGPDRPGLVSALSSVVQKHGGSFADTRMVNLQGHFALLGRIDGDASALDAIGRTLVDETAALGMEVKIHGTSAPVEADRAPRVPWRLKSYSLDQVGIVARLSALLASHAVNIEELASRLEPAPFAGSPLFTVEAVISVPTAVPMRRLREACAALADELGGDIDIDPV